MAMDIGTAGQGLGAAASQQHRQIMGHQQYQSNAQIPANEDAVAVRDLDNLSISQLVVRISRNC
jgi:hypothetical protein